MANKVEIQIIGNNVYAVNAIDGVKTKLGQLQTKATGVDATIKRLGSQLAAYFSARAIINFMQSSIEAYKESEIAVKKLDVALGRSSSGLQRYAADLQKTTVFSDDLITESMSLVAAFTSEEDKIKKITKASMDLAAAKGIDLATATSLITKAIFTEANALSRQGIEVEGVKGSTERLEMAVTNISNLYGGQATEQANTYTGQLIIMNNKLNDQQEIIGQKLIPYYTEALGVLSDLIFEIEYFNDYNRTGAKTYSDMVLGVTKLESTRNELMDDRLALESQMISKKVEEAPLTAAELEALRRKNELLKKQNEQNLIAIYQANNRLQARGIENNGVGVPLEMVATYYDARAQLSLEFTNQEIANWLLMQDVSVEIFSNMAGAALNFYDASGNAAKGWFGVYKAMAIAQTAIATYQSAVEAYKAMVGIPIVGPGLAVAAAAAATAFGLSNIARIASMQPGGSYAGGGSASVPSIPTGNTVNNNQRSNSYSIVINTQGGWSGDKDKFARDIINALRKAEGDGG